MECLLPNNEPFRAVIYQGTIRRGPEHWVLSQDRTRSHPTIYKPQIWRNNTIIPQLNHAQTCHDSLKVVESNILFSLSLTSNFGQP